MNYKLSDAADIDIVNIYAEGVHQFGLAQADLYHDALFDLFDLLSESPRMARERVELSPPVRVHPFKAHVIIFKIEDGDILIIGVRHGREDWLSNSG